MKSFIIFLSPQTLLAWLIEEECDWGHVARKRDIEVLQNFWKKNSE
jgi:hypothetical protein